MTGAWVLVCTQTRGGRYLRGTECDVRLITTTTTPYEYGVVRSMDEVLLRRTGMCRVHTQARGTEHQSTPGTCVGVGVSAACSAKLVCLFWLCWTPSWDLARAAVLGWDGGVGRGTSLT